MLRPIVAMPTYVDTIRYMNSNHTTTQRKWTARLTFEGREVSIDLTKVRDTHEATVKAAVNASRSVVTNTWQNADLIIFREGKTGWQAEIGKTDHRWYKISWSARSRDLIAKVQK